MNTQHTPGPWELIPASSVCPWPAVIRGKTGGFLVHGISKQLCDADARLIAAAPELLEALQHLMVAHGEQLDYAFQQAQAAIARATNA
jgi:hypothetical protein